MLKILKIFSKKNPDENNAPAPRVVLDSRKLCSLLRYFPIGSSLRYFPEYREEIILDSVIIAYLINSELIYSNSEITIPSDESGLILNSKLIDEINSFSILIPSTSRGEAELDYEQKEILEQTGGFSRGNCITLIGQQQDGNIPVVDTIVKKHARLKEGHFDNTRVVILTVDPALLKLKDQRSQARLAARIPGLIQTKLYSEPNPCTIIDFAGHAIKISCESNELIPLSCKLDETVTLTFNLPVSTEPTVMRGKVTKTADSSMVIELKEISREKKFEKLATIDLIEIKAKLLQQPS